MKISLPLISVILFLSMMTGWANDAPETPRTIRVGIFPLEPICFMDKNEEANGLIPDLVREVFPASEGWNVEFVQGSWAEGLQRLQEGSLDLMPCVMHSEERAETMDFSSEAAFESWAQVCVLQGSPIDTWKDLQHKHVAIAKEDSNGINFIKTAELLGISCRTVEFPTHEDVLNAVKTMQVEAGVAPSLFITRHAAEHGLTPTTILFSPSPAYFATARDTHADILQHLDDVLGDWKKDQNSPYYVFVNRWLGISSPHETVIPTWLWFAVGGIFAAAILLMGANHLLQNQVKKRTAELRESEERFDIASDAGGIGIWDHDIIHNYLVWDERMYAIYGVREKDFSGAYEAWQQCLHPEDRASAEEAVIKAETGEKNFDTEFRIIRPDGQIRYIRAFAKIIRNKNGHAVRMIGTNQDITQRKEVEKALEESKLWLENIFNSLEEAVLVVTPTRKFTSANKAAENIFGYSSDELLSLSTEILHVDHEHYMEFGRRIQKAFDRDQTASFEFETKRKNGDIFPSEHTVTRLKDNDGTTLGIVSVVRDITERKISEEALKENASRLTSLFNVAAIGISEVSTEGRWIRVNQKLADIVGYSREELVSLSFQEITHPDDLDKDLEHVQRLLDGKDNTYTMEKRYIRKDGSIIWVELTVSIMRHEDGTPDRFISIISDITARRQAKAELNKNMKELERFNKAAVGRELRMIELKQEINALCQELGRTEPYAELN